MVVHAPGCSITAGVPLILLGGALSLYGQVMDDDFVYPVRQPPGRPLSSGFTYLPEDEQEKFRRQHREMMRRLEPFFRDVDACRRRAMSTAHSYVIG